MQFPRDWPILITPRLRIRPLTEGDAAEVFAIFSNPEVMRYWAWPAMRKADEAVEMIARVRAQFLAGEGLRWGAALKATNRVIGTVSLFHLDPQNRRGEVGYALGRDYWGQGYMSEALGELVDYAFTALDLLRLEADLDPRNAASERLLARLGFAREGLLRERWIVDGEVSDSLMMGLLRREWRR